jgi:hypothetical protein
MASRPAQTQVRLVATSGHEPPRRLVGIYSAPKLERSPQRRCFHSRTPSEDVGSAVVQVRTTTSPAWLPADQAAVQLTANMWVCESVVVEVTVAVPPALMTPRLATASVIMWVWLSVPAGDVVNV